MKKYLLFCVFVLSILLPGNIYGAVSFKVNGPRQVIQGNKFNITYVLENASGSSFKAEEIEGCKFLYGPSISRGSSTYSINGKVTSSTSESYTMIYRADKVGKFTVKPATIVVDGKILKTDSYTLEVLPPDKSASNGSQSQGVQFYDSDTQTADKSIGKDDVFVRIILSKSSAYEQEGIVCTIKLYTKYNIQQFMATLQPSFNGFISQELPITSSINRIENYKGENYMVADLKQCILFPQQSGTLTITSGTYDVTVVQYETFRSMLGMIMRRPVDKQIEVKSNSVTIEIKPLPQPQPNDFYGAVGNFSVSTEMLNNNLKTNESGTLRLTIKGNGNLKNIQTPKIEFPSQFDVYDPQTTVDANPSGNELAGTVTVDYAFVPQYAGSFEIPASSFTYFNPDAKKYITVPIKGYKMEVGQGTSSGGSSMQSNPIAKDILNIKTGDLSLVRNPELLIFKGSYLLWYVIPLLLFGFILYYYRKTIKERANVKLMRTKRANKVAVKRLKTAKQLMAKQQRDAFYEEMLRAIWGYLSDKLSIPVSQLNRDNILAELTKYGITSEISQRILNLLDSCEFARYAKSEEEQQDMSSVYNNASESINLVENSKKKRIN